MKTSLRTAFLLSVFTAIFALAVSAQPAGYKPIDKTDAGAGLAADFAVKQQAKNTKTTITLNEIVSAKDQEPGMMSRNFWLCMKVNTVNKPISVQAVVTVDEYSNMKLASWAPGVCSETGDVYKMVENGDGGAGLAADFAVKAQAKKAKTVITPATIVKAEDQEPALGYRNFRLCLKTTVNSRPVTVQTLVNVDQYSNHKLVSWAESKCGEPDGSEFKPVEAGFTAGADLAADFALKEHTSSTGIVHKLVEILKREERGMFAVTYRICMNVREDGRTQTIQAIVSRDQYSNHKLVSWAHSTCTK